MSTITSEFLKKKAREISYALNRVSFYIKRDDLRNRIERLSFEFLENVAVAAEDVSDRQSLIRVFKNTSALDVLVRIGHSLYEIETINSNILVRELDAFNSAIRKLAEESSAMGNPSAQAGSSEFGNGSARASTELSRMSSPLANSANPFTKQELNLESIFSTLPAVVQKNPTQVIKEPVHSSVVEADPLVQSDPPIQLDSVINQPIRSTVQSTTRPEDKKNSELLSKQIADSVGKDFANIDNEKEIVERAYSSVGERETASVSVAIGESSNLKKEVSNSVSTGQAIIRKFQNGINQQVRDESGNRTIRQNLISEKIRQSGKVNVKELISKFPGVSERTIRYDLQRLCDQGVVEKIGSSGPGTSYSSKLPNP